MTRPGGASRRVTGFALGLARSENQKIKGNLPSQVKLALSAGQLGQDQYHLRPALVSRVPDGLAGAGLAELLSHPEDGRAVVGIDHPFDRLANGFCRKFYWNLNAGIART